MKAENIHFTKKWKKRRKNHDGDRCDNALCPICAAHKKYGGNSSKYDKKRHILAKEKLKFDLNG